MRLITAFLFLLILPRSIATGPGLRADLSALHHGGTRFANNLYIEDNGKGVPAGPEKVTTKPKVLVVSVNGMEWDFIAPLMLRGQMPNLKSLVNRGSYGKLKTQAHATCPKMYSIFFTSTPTEENGIPG